LEDSSCVERLLVVVVAGIELVVLLSSELVLFVLVAAFVVTFLKS